jgi:hypothetical protein
MLTYADVCWRMQALPAMRIAKMDSSKNHVDKDIFKDVDEHAQARSRMLAYAHVCLRMLLTYDADVCC